MRKENNRITSRLLLAIVASMVTMGITAQAPSNRPTLVVGIMVDGLSDDYLQLLKGYFCENGFRKLMSEGVTIENVEYGANIDRAAATAMIYTGTTASVNGISASSVYDRSQKRDFPILLDASKMGNYTNETYSPEALLVSTIADEVRINDNGTGYVYSIAPDATQSILMAGHAANSAFWIDDISGKWATTTYYKDVPTTIQTRNYRLPLSKRLDTLSWTPSLPLTKYPDLPDYRRHYPFRHIFLHNDKDRYRAYKVSAPVNTEVTTIAADYLKTLGLGTRGVTDMLNIGYTLTPYPYTKETDNRVELMDSYIKLDVELSRLFQAIDRTAGMNNTLIFLAGTPAPVSTRRDDEQWNIPSGEFSPRKAISLLNMYLMAIYGNGEWVSGFHNNQFYLNHTLINERGTDARKLRTDAAEFLMRMSGISQAVTIDEIISGTADGSNILRRNCHINHRGDILITVNPGWETIEQINGKDVRTLSRTVATHAPLFILCPHVKAQTITTEVDATIIAPTVSRLLRIRSPNASSTKPLRL